MPRVTSFLSLSCQVVVPKAKGEILGVVIVESGWGSMLPTIVLANLSPTGPAARCGQLNIGDQVSHSLNTHNYVERELTCFPLLQIIAINGISLVGLPLSACQNYIKVSSSQGRIVCAVSPPQY